MDRPHECGPVLSRFVTREPSAGATVRVEWLFRPEPAKGVEVIAAP
ncbi:hypothetical protein [Microbispora bryophytorum]|nr:hypothetical protein [Microbispora camponoti]